MEVIFTLGDDNKSIIKAQEVLFRHGIHWSREHDWPPFEIKKTWHVFVINTTKKDFRAMNSMPYGLKEVCFDELLELMRS